MLVPPSDEENLRYRWLDGTTGKLFPLGAHRWASSPGWSGREPVTLTMTLTMTLTLTLTAAFGECGEGTDAYA